MGFHLYDMVVVLNFIVLTKSIRGCLGGIFILGKSGFSSEIIIIIVKQV